MMNYNAEGNLFLIMQLQRECSYTATHLAISYYDSYT